MKSVSGSAIFLACKITWTTVHFLSRNMPGIEPLRYYVPLAITYFSLGLQGVRYSEVLLYLVVSEYLYAADPRKHPGKSTLSWTY